MDLISIILLSISILIAIYYRNKYKALIKRTEIYNDIYKDYTLNIEGDAEYIKQLDSIKNLIGNKYDNRTIDKCIDLFIQVHIDKHSVNV